MTKGNNTEGVTWPKQVLGLSEQSFSEPTVPEVSTVAGPVQGPSFQELWEQQERQTGKHNQSTSHTAGSHHDGECNTAHTSLRARPSNTSVRADGGLGRLSHWSCPRQDSSGMRAVGGPASPAGLPKGRVYPPKEQLRSREFHGRFGKARDGEILPSPVLEPANFPVLPSSFLLARPLSPQPSRGRSRP